MRLYRRNTTGGEHVIFRRARSIGIAVVALLLLVSTTVLAAPYGSRTLYTGTFGGDVMELQRRLSALGFDAGNADGMFGARTRESVIRFQREYGLVPDGLADKWTFRAVDRAYTWKQGSFYTVVPGDTLWQIAQANNTKVEALVWLNQLQDTMLYPGQALRLPGTGDPNTSPNPPVVNPPPGGTLPQPGGGTTPQPGNTGGGTLPGEPGGTTQPPPVQRTGPVVLGYYAEDWQGDTGSLNSLKASRDQVNLVVNFSLLVDATGKITTRDYPGLMAEAQARSIPVQGLLHNFVGSGFDSAVARAVLMDPATRAKTIANLVSVAKAKALAGINVDIENVPPDCRPGYTAFVKELAAKLKPEGMSLSLSIPAKTFDDTKSPWSAAFDYKALGQYADKIVPMTYDEHSPGYTAGPVASFPWVEKVVAFAASQMPPEKVLMGIAAYGYDWKKGTYEARGISTPAAVSVAAKHGAAIQWDATARVPYFSYNSSGTDRIVYFESAQSTAHKLDLVKKYGLGGVAIWRMGLEDPAIWSVIDQKLP